MRSACHYNTCPTNQGLQHGVRSEVERTAFWDTADPALVVYNQSSAIHHGIALLVVNESCRMILIEWQYVA